MSQQKNLGGRPTKLNDALIVKICDAIRGGNYIEVAAAYAGINKDTLYRWLKMGARSKRQTIHRRFSDAVEKALADSEVRDVLLIANAAKTQWQAAAWRLERKNFKRWGRKDRVELTGGEDEHGAPKMPEIRIELVRPEGKGSARIRHIPAMGEPTPNGALTNGHHGNGNGDSGA